MRVPAAIVVVLVAVVGGAYVLTRSHGPAARAALGKQTLGVRYGATRSQLAAKLGQPAIKQRNCWLYRGSGGGMVDGIYAGVGVDAVRFCFVGGAVSTIGDHDPVYGWSIPVQVIQGTVTGVAQSCYSPHDCG